MSYSKEELQTEIENYRDRIKELIEEYKQIINNIDNTMLNNEKTRIIWKERAIILSDVVEDLEELLK